MENIITLLEKVNNKPVYNKVAIQFPGLIEEEELNHLKNLVDLCLTELETDVNELLFSKIKYSKNQEEANRYFDILQQFQEILSKLYFREKINLSLKMQTFVRDCDRLDDDWLRGKLFKQIKKGVYFDM